MKIDRGHIVVLGCPEKLAPEAWRDKNNTPTVDIARATIGGEAGAEHRHLTPLPELQQPPTNSLSSLCLAPDRASARNRSRMRSPIARYTGMFWTSFSSMCCLGTLPLFCPGLRVITPSSSMRRRMPSVRMSADCCLPDTGTAPHTTPRILDTRTTRDFRSRQMTRTDR
jgi:hypothetical protein